MYDFFEQFLRHSGFNEIQTLKRLKRGLIQLDIQHKWHVPLRFDFNLLLFKEFCFIAIY